MKKEEPMYSTVEIVYVFSELLRDGYSAVNMKLITDLIERDCELPQAEKECECQTSI